MPIQANAYITFSSYIFFFVLFFFCFYPWPYILNILISSRKTADVFSMAVHLFNYLFWKMCPQFLQILITCLKCSRASFCLPLIAKGCTGGEVGEIVHYEKSLISVFQEFFLVLTKFSFWQQNCTLGHHPIMFRNFFDIS